MNDDDRYRICERGDRRFDGVFIVGVTTTGIYCRPSCPARTPQRRNVRFFPTAAAAQGAQLRACKRCRPDASPGSAEWNARQDVVARAMRLIADGEVDRSGVSGLASGLGYSRRHLTRLMTAELGAGPLALARAQRVRTARALIEGTRMPFTDVAFAAGFDSIRQFNDDVRTTHGLTPTDLRARVARRATSGTGEVLPAAVRVRLAHREPYDQFAMIGFLRARCIDGVESMTDDGCYTRSLRLPSGEAVVSLSFADSAVDTRWRLSDLADLAPGVARLRRMFDLDGDPEEVDQVLSAQPPLAKMVDRHRGLRVPGTVDGFELAVRAIVGQQISVIGARRLLDRIVNEHGERLPEVLADHDATIDASIVTCLFPTAHAIAVLQPPDLPLPRRRATTIIALAQAVVDGDVHFGVAEDLAQLRSSLLALAGIGTWTADYVVMRSGHPDILLATDLIVRRALERLRIEPNDTDNWVPWRSTATMHLWKADQ